MGLKQCLRGEPEVQGARRSHFEAVVVDRRRHRPAADGVIPVADRVGKRLPQSRRRIPRLIHPVETVGLDAAGDRQVLTKEAFRAAQERERVAVNLSVVQKLVGTRGAVEPGNPQHALRILGADPLRPAEQHDRGAEQPVGAEQTESTQQLRRVTRSGLVRPPAANRVLERTHYLGLIEIVDRPIRDRLIFPSELPVQAFQQHAVVLVPRHGLIGAADPTASLAPVTVGLLLPDRHGYHQHLTPATCGDPIDGGERRRIYFVQLRGELFNRAFSDELADHPPGRLHAEQHLAAPVIQHGAHSPHAGTALAGGLLQLQGLRLAGRGQRLDLCQGHVRGAPNTSEWRRKMAFQSSPW